MGRAKWKMSGKGKGEGGRFGEVVTPNSKVEKMKKIILSFILLMPR